MKQFFLVLTILVSSLYALAQNDSISRNHELKEVVVKATRPLSKFDTDGIITTVTGTPLQTLETANDILGYLPGITNQNGAIEVIGKGQPIIYINGRKLLNISELDHLPASKVKDVKVINNPGARYGGDVNAVIRISTVKELGDGFSLNSRATAGVRHYFYTKEILNMNYRTGGLDISRMWNMITAKAQVHNIPCRITGVKTNDFQRTIDPQSGDIKCWKEKLG